METIVASTAGNITEIMEIMETTVKSTTGNITETMETIVASTAGNITEIMETTVASTTGNIMETIVESTTGNIIETGIINIENILPFTFDHLYKGSSEKIRVAEILNIDQNDHNEWEIVDKHITKEGSTLVLVHYKDTANFCKYGWLRGVVVDLIKGIIVVSSFGYTPTCVYDELIPNENGDLILEDLHGSTHTFAKDKTTIKSSFEGVVMRVIWYDNEFFTITHRKIIPSKSRWGNSKTFNCLYQDACGPQPDQLFNINKKYSSTCYVFLVVDTSLFIATKQIVKAPYIVLLSKFEINIAIFSEDFDVGIHSIETTNEISSVVTNSCIHIPQNLTISQANDFLQNGYSVKQQTLDKRMGSGESVIIYSTDDDGKVSKVIKVNSSSVQFRTILRSDNPINMGNTFPVGNNPNITHQFFRLIDNAKGFFNKQNDLTSFSEKFILLNPEEIKYESLKEIYKKDGKICTIGTSLINNHKYYKNRDTRIRVIWANYLISLPPHLQGEGLELLTYFNKGKKTVTDWIKHMEKQLAFPTFDVKSFSPHRPIGTDLKHDLFKPEITKRLLQIITQARTAAFNFDVCEKEKSKFKTNVKQTRQMISVNISNLIQKEFGNSLYRLVCAHDKITKYRNSLN